jgi:hypothetical protein
LAIIGVIQKVVAQLIILIILQKIAGIAAAGAGAGAGAAGTASAGSEGGAVAVSTLPFRAGGGPVSSSGAFLVGERGPEVFQPPRSGRIIPNEQIGESMRPTVNVQVVNVTDPKEVTSVISSKEGEEVILNVLSRNRGRARQAIGA